MQDGAEEWDAWQTTIRSELAKIDKAADTSFWAGIRTALNEVQYQAVQAEQMLENTKYLAAQAEQVLENTRESWQARAREIRALADAVVRAVHERDWDKASQARQELAEKTAVMKAELPAA